jgi:hypothetical protein
VASLRAGRRAGDGQAAELHSLERARKCISAAWAIKFDRRYRVSRVFALSVGSKMRETPRPWCRSDGLASVIAAPGQRACASAGGHADRAFGRRAACVRARRAPARKAQPRCPSRPGPRVRSRPATAAVSSPSRGEPRAMETALSPEPAVPKGGRRRRQRCACVFGGWRLRRDALALGDGRHESIHRCHHLAGPCPEVALCPL